MKDKLISAFTLKLCMGGDAVTTDKDLDRKRYSINDMCAIIDAQSSIDAEPVKHGRWVGHLEDDSKTPPGGYMRSACGSVLQFTRNLYYKTAYCPHCGAKMDGKDSQK